jgi:hypothetical protein
MILAVRFRRSLAIAAVACGLAIGALAQDDAHGSSARRPAAESSSALQRTNVPPQTKPAARANPSSSSAVGTIGSSANPPTQNGAASPTLESARQRWERLTPEEKLRARERYEKYLALSEAERAELAERAQRLKEDGARVQRELSPEVRDKLSTLEPAKRHELIGELLESEAKEKGQRIRELLPENVVKRLEAARPEDRARFLAEFKVQQRKRVARYAIDQLGRRLKISPQEVERLKNLTDDERAEAVLQLKKQLSEREAEEFGLPPGLTRREWDAWAELSPEEFFEQMQRYQHARLLERASIERTRDEANREPSSDETNDVAPRISPDAAHDASPPRNGTKSADAAHSNGSSSSTAPAHGTGSNDAARTGARSKSELDRERAPLTPEKLQAFRRLADARRLRPSDLVDLAPLSKAERAARVEHRRRERCLAAIREGELLPPDRIDELSKAPNAAFFESVRRLIATADLGSRRLETR